MRDRLLRKIQVSLKKRRGMNGNMQAYQKSIFIIFELFLPIPKLNETCT